MATLPKLLETSFLKDNSNYCFYADNTTESDAYTPTDNIKTFDRRGAEKAWKTLHAISADIQQKLSKENEASNLVIFNQGDYEHNSDDNFFTVGGRGADSFFLQTGNIIGFVKKDGVSITISSRFGDAFLKYIISDTDGFLELEDMSETSQNNGYEWLLAYLWSIKLKRAFLLGLPKAYISKNEQVTKVRGNIDPVDYALNRRTGKYLCSYREHSYNTPAASLFLRAYESIKSYSFVQKSHTIYTAFMTASEGKKYHLQQLLQTSHFTNPFYQDYNVLIDLSKQILKQKNTDVSQDQQSSGFLFDVSMLFEFFIRKLFKEAGIPLQGKSNFLQISAGAFGSYQRKLYPDIVFDIEGKRFVFDVKYKSYDVKYGVKREDIFQLHTYIGQWGNDRPIGGCGFIYPMREAKWLALELEKKGGIIEEVIMQQGKEIPFYILFLCVPDDENLFQAAMVHSCDCFKNKIRQIAKLA